MVNIGRYIIIFTFFIRHRTGYWFLSVTTTLLVLSDGVPKSNLPLSESKNYNIFVTLISSDSRVLNMMLLCKIHCASLAKASVEP